MAIQYSCPGCGRAIEVDEPFAGQSAACPYCGHVSTVPQASTYRPDAIPAAARPASAPRASAPPPQADDLHVGPKPKPLREVRGRRLGSAALACAALAGGLLCVLFVFSLSVEPPFDPTIPQTREEVFRQAAEHAREVVREHPWLPIAQTGAVMLMALGFALGVAGVALHARGNWAAVVAIVVSGAMALFICCGLTIWLSSGAGL